MREHRLLQMTGARTDQYTNRDVGYWGVWQVLKLAREMRDGFTSDGFDVKPVDKKDVIDPGHYQSFEKNSKDLCSYFGEYTRLSSGFHRRCTSHAQKLGSIPRQRTILLEIFLYSTLAVQEDVVNMC